ncbi:hypothetical protein OSSY52_03060 [Tepiditoga spiralis]|uniref:Uncharacterized protein n=1 Tax=Tepiditoga spiralis TaxID=2108365 RepID=A0A7G1G2R8_9BACT|nr:hypothetical protein [Tepiditoga spiralis]BBE30165.1 hypothetical protein OSSY52_03060 [Tepiditoga spiralis]
MKSFVKYFNDLHGAFHNDLNLQKNIYEIPKLFNKHVSILLKSIYSDLSKNILTDIYFDESSEKHFIISDELLEIIKEDWNNSDLKVLIEKMAKETYDRIIHLKKDNDKTETYRKI